MPSPTLEPIFQEIPHLAGIVNSALGSISDWDARQFSHLTNQPWYQDGLTDEEAALIVVLGGIHYSFGENSEQIYEELTSGAHVRSNKITLPLAGETRLYAISRSETELDELLEGMTYSVQELENFMGAPWPIDDVIVLFETEPGISRLFAGWNSGDYVVLRSTYPILRHHELAHFYFSRSDVPYWLSEGAAVLMSFYIAELTGDWTIPAYHYHTRAYLSKRCAPLGVSNVFDWTEISSKGEEAPVVHCAMPVGSTFTSGMYAFLGHETVSSALRDLYEISRVKSTIVDEEEIYQAFLQNTASTVRGEFRDRYKCLHGGSVPGNSDDPQGGAADWVAREALETFFHATNGPDWEENRNWLTDAPLGEWYGVSVSCEGEVTGLFLSNSGLHGILPAELGNLEGLRVMVLNSNQLTGAVPPELGKLSNLKILDLAANHLSGPIPPELGWLSNLERLSIGGNQLTGPIPKELANLKKLTYVEFGGNQLAGCVPETLQAVKNRYFHIPDC